MQQLSNQKLTSKKVAKLITQSETEEDSLDKWQRVNLQEIIKKHKLAISVKERITAIPNMTHTPVVKFFNTKNCLKT